MIPFISREKKNRIDIVDLSLKWNLTNVLALEKKSNQV